MCKETSSTLSLSPSLYIYISCSISSLYSDCLFQGTCDKIHLEEENHVFLGATFDLVSTHRVSLSSLDLNDITKI